MSSSINYQVDILERKEKARSGLAVTSFGISLIPPSTLALFAIYLAIEQIMSSSNNNFPFLLEILLMIFLGLMLYIACYALCITSLIMGLRGLKSKKKKFAILGIIISVFNFSIPFLISPVNELFLR